jgi:hypothetical protein
LPLSTHGKKNMLIIIIIIMCSVTSLLTLLKSLKVLSTNKVLYPTTKGVKQENK